MPAVLPNAGTPRRKCVDGRYAAVSVPAPGVSPAPLVVLTGSFNQIDRRPKANNHLLVERTRGNFFARPPESAAIAAGLVGYADLRWDGSPLPLDVHADAGLRVRRSRQSIFWP
ncbi:MAG: hypothetical protein ACR2P2_19675 [Nakamurella sp.]